MILAVMAAVSLVISLSVFFTCFGTVAQLYWILVIFAGSFLGLVLIWALSLIVCTLFVNRKKPCRKHSPLFRFYANCIIDCTIRLMRIKLHVTGKEKLPKEKFLLVGNHQSFLDPVITMWVLRKYRMGFVGASDAIFKFPVMKNLLHKVFCVPIDRQSARDGVRMVNEAAEIIKCRAASVGIYPEGRRNLDGGELLPLKTAHLKLRKRQIARLSSPPLKTLKRLKRIFRSNVRASISISSRR